MRQTDGTRPVKATCACPLCGRSEFTEWHRELGHEYWRCEHCALVFLSPAQRLAFDAEVERYRLHRNNDDDPGYLRFLSRLAAPMIARVPEGARGLDYGCGPSTALALLMTQSGRPTAAHDPVFHPDASALGARYDFVTCSEVLEHIHQPLVALQLMEGLLEKHGKIGIMTRWYDGQEPFGAWSYRRDPTHVCFYSEHTMRWIAEHFGWELSIPATDVAIYTIGGQERNGNA